MKSRHTLIKKIKIVQAQSTREKQSVFSKSESVSSEDRYSATSPTSATPETWLSYREFITKQELLHVTY